MSVMGVLKLIGASIVDKPLEIIDNQLRFYQERKNAEQAQQLKQEEAQFMQKLEFERQKFNAELDDMIARKEIERGALVLDAIKDYQVTMAECATSISESLGKMTIELRRQAHDLMEEKKRAYIQMQSEMRRDAQSQLKEIYADFPEGSRARTIMEDAVNEQLVIVIENSKSFMKMIDADFAKMTDNLDSISKTAQANANQYISQTFGGLISNQIRGDDKKLLR